MPNAWLIAVARVRSTKDQERAARPTASVRRSRVMSLTMNISIHAIEKPVGDAKPHDGSDQVCTREPGAKLEMPNPKWNTRTRRIPRQRKPAQVGSTGFHRGRAVPHSR